MSCSHERFESSVEVHRLEDATGHVLDYSADIRIRCAQCHQPFAFKGVDCGLSPHRPMTSLDNTELRAPIEPSPIPVQIPHGNVLAMRQDLN